MSRLLTLMNIIADRVYAQPPRAIERSLDAIIVPDADVKVVAIERVAGEIESYLGDLDDEIRAAKKEIVDAKQRLQYIREYLHNQGRR